MANITEPVSPKQDNSPAKLYIVPASATPAPSLLGFSDNDTGNAERIIVMYGDSIRYCHAFKKWLIWDGQRWLIDTSEQIRRLATLTMKDFWHQIDGDDKRERRAFASASLNRSRITDMLASIQPYLSISTEDMDTDPDLLNFTNGIVDLRTGELLPHDPTFYITRLVHHAYTPSATCPVFLRFLASITEPHPKLAEYIQTALGYSLTGHTREKVVFLPWGSGDNGKSTLLTTIFKLVFEYACLLQIDTLMTKQETSNTLADLADLRGTRFVMTSETDKGQRLAEGKLKRITQGMGGRIKSTRKYENPIEFDETHKIWIDANNLPIVRGTDPAIWNRLHPIPFSVTFEKAAQDKTLQSKLLAESEGILAWLIVGARRWHEHRLPRPPEIGKILRKWQSQSDQVTAFLAERCIIAPNLHHTPCKVTSSVLYEAYSEWARGEDDADKIYSKRDFGSAVLKLKEITLRKRNDANWYLGVKLRPISSNGRIGSRPEEQDDQDENGGED